MPPYFYNQNTNTCVHCLTDPNLFLCTSCSSFMVCTACITGISALNSSSLCDYCSNIIKGCIACVSSTSCTVCVSGLFPSSGGCLNCLSYMEGCISCSSNSTCLTCTAPFFLNTSGLCQKCGSPNNYCAACIDGVSCT